MLFKDACNAKSNQQNLGTIKSSNLCTEIVEYTAPDEVAVCNLASLNLSSFVNESDKSYDFQNLYKVTKVVTRNLNKVWIGFSPSFHPVPLLIILILTRLPFVTTTIIIQVIDVNFYPVEEARNSNMRHRPIGMGVQGLADAFAKMRMPFDSPAAMQLNKVIKIT